MKKIIDFLSVGTFLFLSAYVTAQTDLAIGEWKTLNSYNNPVSVTQSTENVYFATKYGIVVLDKTENSLSYLSRQQGLSGIDISVISYNLPLKTLIVTYENGNIDLVEDNQKVTNVQDIYKANITGERKINHINSVGEDIYLSCSFGLVKFNLTKRETRFTTFTNTPVKSSVLYHDTLWIATRKGVYKSNPAVNLMDFNSWKKETVLSGMPAKYVCNGLAVLNDKLYAAVADSIYQTLFQGDIYESSQDSIYQYDGKKWKKYSYSGNGMVSSMMADGEKLVLNTNLWARQQIHLLYPDGRVFFTNKDDFNSMRDAIGDLVDRNKVWTAAYYGGMHGYDIANDLATPIKPSSPQGNKFFASAVDDAHNVWVASGSIVPGNWFSVIFNGDGIYKYNQGDWQTWNDGNTLALKNFLSYTCIAVRPSDNHIFFGGIFKGLAEFDGTTVKVYNQTNSSLQDGPSDDMVRVSGLAFDKDNNLWVSNLNAQRPLSVMKPNGEWKNFSLPQTNISDIAIDDNGYKWIAGGGGVVVFSEGDLEQNGDEKIAQLKSTDAGTELKSDKIHTVAVDLEGDVWVGTDKGLTPFQCASQVFSSESCKGSCVVITLGGNGECLFQQDPVYAVSIDGANRKWVGTSVGLFVLSPDARTTIHHFTKENSPLPSNTVMDISFDKKTGEAFICTDNGMVAYRAPATWGTEVQDKTLHVFPNPVRPDYDGLIAINTLTRDADVKITDITGTLVYQTTALGGQAVWNGRDYNGQRVASGVYLVYAANNTGQEAAVTKLFFIK